MALVRVLVTNLKGGCGKTTIATNLAAAFAASGLRTALAEVDRQKSSLGWLGTRPGGAAPIVGLDWRKELSPVSPGVQRLVIDAPAALTMRHVDDLIGEADIVIVPILPSVFDEGSTRRFLDKLEELKPVRKGRKTVAVVANRLRPRTRAATRLDAFLAGIDRSVVARLTDRSLYADLASRGLGLFDPAGQRQGTARAEWQPLLATIESLGG